MYIAKHDTPRSKHCEHDPRVECHEGYEGREAGHGGLTPKQLQQRWGDMSEDERRAAGNAWAIDGQMAHALALMQTHEPEHVGVPKQRSSRAFKVVLVNANARLESYSARLPEDAVGLVRDELPATVVELQRSSFPASGDMRDLDEYMSLVVDALVYQEQQTWRRQLGDHGIRHILDDVEHARDLGEQVHGHTGTVTHDDLAMGAASAVFHDIGYTADAARKTLEGTKYHPRYSADYVKHNSKLFNKVFGSRNRRQVEEYILTHQDHDIDWFEDPVGTSIRVADNLALFQREKLPALFKYVPGATATLGEIAKNPSQYKELKGRLKQQVRDSKLKPNLKRDLLAAAEEVAPVSPKFTLGMFSGERLNPSFDGETMHIPIKWSDEAKHIQETFGNSQARYQFKKLAESYQHGEDAFQRGEATFKGKGGSLHVKVVGAPDDWLEKALRLSAAMFGVLNKHLPGKHDQKDHGREGPLVTEAPARGPFRMPDSPEQYFERKYEDDAVWEGYSDSHATRARALLRDAGLEGKVWLTLVPPDEAELIAGVITKMPKPSRDVHWAAPDHEEFNSYLRAMSNGLLSDNIIDACGGATVTHQSNDASFIVVRRRDDLKETFMKGDDPRAGFKHLNMNIQVLGVAAHEYAHALDTGWSSNETWFRAWVAAGGRTILHTLMGFEPKLFGGSEGLPSSYASEDSSEGLAECMALMAIDPEMFNEDYPNLYRAIVEVTGWDPLEEGASTRVAAALDDKQTGKKLGILPRTFYVLPNGLHVQVFPRV